MQTPNFFLIIQVSLSPLLELLCSQNVAVFKNTIYIVYHKLENFYFMYLFILFFSSFGAYSKWRLVVMDRLVSL